MEGLVLTHYSKEPFVFDPHRKYVQPSVYDKNVGFKPQGLWLSHDESGWGWADWVKAEDFYPEHLVYATEFRLRREVPLEVLRSVADIMGFMERHLVRCPYYLSKIDWQGVAGQFGGVIITPHLWHEVSFVERLTEAVWYSGWDCASGCVWDLRCLEQLGSSIYLSPPAPKNRDILHETDMRIEVEGEWKC